VAGAGGTPEAPVEQTATLLCRQRDEMIAKSADFLLERVATGFVRGFRSTSSPGYAVELPTEALQETEFILQIRLCWSSRLTSSVQLSI